MSGQDLFRSEVFEARNQRLFGEVVLTQTLSTKVMVAALFAGVMVAGLWVALGSYSRIETVPGILVTDKATAKVYALQSGVVAELAATDGQIVKSGDKLVVIKLDRQGESGRDILSQSAMSIDERLLMGNEQIFLFNERMMLERRRLQGVVATSTQQIESLSEQIELQSQVVESNRQIFNQISKVVERGFVSKVEFERRRQMLIAAEQQLESLKQQRLTRQSESEQARAQIMSLSMDVAISSGEIRSQQSALEQQKTQIEGERSYVITAPISGRVTALQTAIGRTATAQTPLMVIVPPNARLRAELYAPTRAIGFVTPGQETRLLFDAFPYQRFGSFGGKVSSVSQAIFDPRETDVPLKLEQAVYKITVELDHQHPIGQVDNIYLQPGMTLSANIVLERQSFLDWILAPLNAVRKRAA